MNSTPVTTSTYKILSDTFTADDLKRRLKPLLRQASEICGTRVSVVNLVEGSGCRTLEAFHNDQPDIVSVANKISSLSGPETGLKIINNAAGDLQIASKLSEQETKYVSFYAGMPIRSETGDAVGYLCVCDPEPKDLSDFQKEHLQTLADGAKAMLQLYTQGELLNKTYKKLDRLSALLDNSTDVTFTLDDDSGQIKSVNHGIEKILGYTSGDLIGTQFQRIVDSEQIISTPVRQWFEADKLKNGRYEKQLIFIDQNGTKKWMQCRFSRKDDIWLVSAGDISDQKKAEERVVELKDKFKKVVGVSTDLIYELDWQTGDLSWGDELTAVLGYPNSDRFVDYNWWLDKIHPEDLERVIHDVAKSVDGESDKMELVYRIRTYEGSYKFVMNYNHVERTDDGTPNNIVGAIKDISNLVESEKKSDKNKKLLEELADNAWLATWIRDSNGTFIFSNDKYNSLFNVADGNVTGLSLDDIFDKSIAEEIRATDKQVLDSGTPMVYEETTEVNGETRYYKINLFPLYGIPGLDNIVGGVAMDITSEKESRELIEQALEEKETLIREIHHRVKNNLAVVSGMMHLQAFSESDEHVQEKLFASTNRIKTMATIHELLYQSTSFTDLKLDENIELLITSISDTYQVSIDLDISYELDSVELNINQAIPCSLIVNEVVTNVFKHAYDDSDSGILTVMLHEENGMVNLKIRDDGKGLPDDFKAQTSDGSLGLVLIDTLVSQLDGDYSYKSLENGAEFNLSFKKSKIRGIGSYSI